MSAIQRERADDRSRHRRGASERRREAHRDAELRANARITASKPPRRAAVAERAEIVLKDAAERRCSSTRSSRRTRSSAGGREGASPAGRSRRARSTSRSAPDGSTPTALRRAKVELTLPAEPEVAERTITADALEAKGEPGRGLTRALFTGDVVYRERGAGVDRGARSATLDVGLKPGSARSRTPASRATCDSRTAACRAGRRGPTTPRQGTLALSGSEPGALSAARRQRADHGGRDERGRRRSTARVVKAIGSVKSSCSRRRRQRRRPANMRTT